jgi:hypothetical protein
MHALAGHNEQAHAALKIALERDPQLRLQAVKDPDFVALRKQGYLADLLGSQDYPGPGAIQPKGPPAPGTDDANGQPGEQKGSCSSPQQCFGLARYFVGGNGLRCKRSVVGVLD